MELLSEDDLNLKEMTREELDRAWDLWFDLAQATNDFDPPYTHGVFVLCEPDPQHVTPPFPTPVESPSRTDRSRRAAASPRP
jgi:hypothetical protein